MPHNYEAEELIQLLGQLPSLERNDLPRLDDLPDTVLVEIMARIPLPQLHVLAVRGG